MGMHAGLHALSIVENCEQILAIEYLIAAQALDFRDGFQLGDGTQACHALLRRSVTFMEEDRVLYPDLELARALISSGELAAVVSDYI